LRHTWDARVFAAADLPPALILLERDSMSITERPLRPITPPDHDVHKGAVEDRSPSGTTNAPALDADGLPNDAKTIAENAAGARADGTQG
jgi:hypothetical protein